MKKLFLPFLILSCFGLFQSALSQDEAIKLQAANYPFVVSSKALATTIDTTVASFYSAMTSTDAQEAQDQYLSFMSDSGLYSGFGTAWYRKNGASLNPVNTVDRFEQQIELHCDFFDASLIQKEVLDLPLFQPELQVSVGYRNFF